MRDLSRAMEFVSGGKTETFALTVVISCYVFVPLLCWFFVSFCFLADFSVHIPTTEIETCKASQPGRQHCGAGRTVAGPLRACSVETFSNHCLPLGSGDVEGRSLTLPHVREAPGHTAWLPLQQLL